MSSWPSSSQSLRTPYSSGWSSDVVLLVSHRKIRHRKTVESFLNRRRIRSLCYDAVGRDFKMGNNLGCRGFPKKRDWTVFPTTQSAYRQHHSTETALLWVKNDILLNMNRQHVTLLVLLDLSAAFDTVDHTILLIFFALASASLEQLLYGLNPIFL